ncbi:hypothetical protein AUK40_05240 [Candidatus Wirthbacteria bacterium CG2_30_54_11]|uniref:Transcription factor NikR nickel binding C-terminal domain-containing protein n=1 Tax=Candidatus Wirthbacteria bacterium CG2_30_54_11 TaxID=1817892 RepID=A0A1J5IP18_9BACT|nr:MAG: hypothetical protein AUK40_05240 [Candidatus Wirthbacteria bacterium CG2_30_54_11]
MSKTTRISLSLPEDLVQAFDRYFADRGLRNRSQAYELIARDYLSHATLPVDLTVAGAFLVFYDQAEKNVLRSLDAIVQEYHDAVMSVQELFISDSEKQTAIFVRGQGRRIQAMSDRLLGIKGIRLGRSLVQPLKK